MRHTISVLVENKFGVLTRVAGSAGGGDRCGMIQYGTHRALRFGVSGRLGAAPG